MSYTASAFQTLPPLEPGVMVARASVEVIDPLLHDQDVGLGDKVRIHMAMVIIPVGNAGADDTHKAPVASLQLHGRDVAIERVVALLRELDTAFVEDELK